MHDALARHDILLRDAIEQNGGRVFKTVGDGFCAVFMQASDALAAAIAAQQRLYDEEFSAVGGLHVRMGLHVGQAAERDGDYFGPAVNRVARLMSIGYGGQVLLSAAARDLVCNNLPAGASLIDLGSHRLKDLLESEHVWQLAVAGLPQNFPELKSLERTPNNLPVQLTPLRGRERDLELAKEMLGSHRLVSIVGPGGVGKTRMALQTAAELFEHFPDGVWLVELAPVDDPQLVATMVAKVLRVSVAEQGSVADSVARSLAQKRLLLVLDNCEHVLSGVAGVVATILQSAPNVSILATSRQTLGLSGETLFQLPALAVPPDSDAFSADDALRFGAIALFVDRAKAADAQFALTNDNAPTVAEICRRLDGIPLAIELAAARVKLLSLPNLAKRLNERFKVLTGRQWAEPRQQTLTALIDWSYKLLGASEQTLFNRLSVFAGGFTIESATAVCADQNIQDVDVFDLLSSLVDKSLVVADVGKAKERYSLLESMRAFAADRLTSAGECDRLTRGHAQYFHDVALAADEESCNISLGLLLERLDPEMDNFRTALDWALRGNNDSRLGGAMAGALEQLWFEGGLSVEGRHWITASLQRISDDEQPAIAARLWRALSLLHSGTQKHDCALRARDLYRSLADAHGEAHAVRSSARGLMQMGRLGEAMASCLDALKTFRAIADRQGEALCLNTMADIAANRGEIDAARDMYEQTLRVYRALGDDAGKAMVLASIAELHFEVGDFAHALRDVQEAIKLDARRNNATNLAIEYSNSAAYRIAMADLQEARRAAREGLRWAQRAQSASKTAWILQHFALMAGLSDKTALAARLLGYVDARYKELGLERERTERWGHDKLMSLLQERMTEGERLHSAAQGAAWTESTAVGQALSI